MTFSKWFYPLALIAFAPVFASAQAAGNPAAGKEKSAVCASCHGVDGISVMAPVPGIVVPHLAGQHADYLAKTLVDYRSGARKNASMTAMAAALSDEDIEDLAAFYAGLPGLTVVENE